MENRVADYTFTIIEDGQVPLAGNFDTFSYAPVIMAVTAVLVLLAIAMYMMWIVSKARLIGNVIGDKAVIVKYFFHPAKLIRDERDYEYSLLNEADGNLA